MRVLYIDIDSLRPDHLGCYGYARPTSPQLDAVAAEGVRFNHYYCANSPCVPSRAAMFSATPGIRSGIVTHETTPAGCDFRFQGTQRHGERPTLAHRLAAADVHTASFTTFADRHSAGWFTFGFRELHVPSLKGGNEDAPEVNAAFLPWLADRGRNDNWFVHLNYWDPHTLYTQPTDYVRQMRSHPAPQWPDAQTIQRQQSDVGIRSASMLWGNHAHDGFGKSRVPDTMPDAISSRSDFEHLINGYDGAIRYLDDQLAAVFDQLKSQGLWDQTAIIISGDHGEAFGELGQYAEHGSCSRSVHRLPLIIRWPGITDAAAGTSRDDLLLNTDLAPTITSSLGLELPQGWPGRSFLDALRGRGETRSDTLVWTHGLHTRQRAVFDGRWLFIRTYEPGWHTYPPRMLFDTQDDPHEQHDLAEAEPARVAAMQRHLLEWERSHVVATGHPDPMRQATAQPPKPPAAIQQVLDRLGAAGRFADGDRLRDVRGRIPTDYAPLPLQEISPA